MTPTAFFDIQAHRGGRDARPENTLAAFAYALELGVTTLEMDMQLTHDGHVVISHDPWLNPALARDADGRYVQPGEYDIRSMTLAEVKSFDVGVMNPAAGEYYEAHGATQVSAPGSRIPTLAEVFDLVISYGRADVRLNIETKSYADPLDPAHRLSPDPALFVRIVYDTVRKFGMEERVTLQSFDWRTLTAMQKLYPRIDLSALSCEQPSWGREGCCLRLNEREASPWLGGLNIHDFGGNYVRAAKAIGAHAVSPYYMELTPALVCEAHTLGMRVLPWTVNSQSDMEAMLDMGIDGIITDRPKLLREILARRGLALPAVIRPNGL